MFDPILHYDACSSFSTERSKAFPLLQFVFFCVSVVSFVAFALPLFVPHLFLFMPREICASGLWHFLGMFTNPLPFLFRFCGKFEYLYT